MDFSRSWTLDFDLRLAPEGEVDPMSLNLRQFENEEQAFALFEDCDAAATTQFDVHYHDINYAPSMNTFKLKPTTSKVSPPQFCMRRVARSGRFMLERAGPQKSLMRWVLRLKLSAVKLAGTLTLPVIVFGFYNALSPNVRTKFF
jgi:hypothetical protein